MSYANAMRYLVLPFQLEYAYEVPYARTDVGYVVTRIFMPLAVQTRGYLPTHPPIHLLTWDYLPLCSS